jgi:hypothetical protein
MNSRVINIVAPGGESCIKNPASLAFRPFRPPSFWEDHRKTINNQIVASFAVNKYISLKTLLPI